MIKQQFLILFILVSLMSFSQQSTKDSLVIKDIYGFRFGIDISNPVRTLFDDNRTSIELVADYRINKKLYAAAEIGFLSKKTQEDYLNFTTNGQYIKLGANYNLYENWLDMENEIYIGLRYGYSNFKQSLHNYTVFSDSQLPAYTDENEIIFNGLSAHWGELVFGMKVEVFNNIFLGASASFKKIVSTKEPENFKNLFIPGFDRVYLNNGGFGFNYTISYRLPLYKKRMVSKKNEEDN